MAQLENLNFSSNPYKAVSIMENAAKGDTKYMYISCKKMILKLSKKSENVYIY